MPDPSMKSRSAHTGRPYKHISQACQNCRAARAKCDGIRPCARCSERYQDCIYAPAGDGRSSRLDCRYKVAELQHENWVLKHFLSYLQQSSEQASNEALARLRGISATHLRRDVDVLVNITHQVSSHHDQPHTSRPNALTNHHMSSPMGFSPSGPCTSSSVPEAPWSGFGAASDFQKEAASAADHGWNLRRYKEIERLVHADNGLLRLLRSLREISTTDRDLVLQSLLEPFSSHTSEQSAVLSALTDRLAEQPPASPYHILGSPRARDLPTSSAVLANGYPPDIQVRQLLNFTLPEFAILPLTFFVPGDKSVLEAFFVSFLDAVSSALAQGTHVDQILGPNFVNAEYLLRNREPHEHALTVAVWAGSVTRSIFTTDLVTPLAGLICLTRLLRWMISPTLQNYTEIPEIARPLLVQRFVPHHPDLDLATHPIIRTALIHRYRNDWLTAFDTAGVHIRWPGSPNDILEIDPKTGHRRPTKLFESHVTCLDNWSFEKTMLEKYPELVQHGVRIWEE